MRDLSLFTAHVTADSGRLAQVAVRLRVKPDRRQSEDRRRQPRGGRRAGDTQIAAFTGHPRTPAGGSEIHRVV